MEEPQGPHRTRRSVAVVAATAVVAGALGVGGGYLVGHGLGGPAKSTAHGSTQRNATYGGSGSSGGTQAIPGNPGWRWSTGNGRLRIAPDPFGGSPFGGSPFGPPGGSNGSSGSSTASAKQITGLVRIVSTMKYAGSKAAGTGMVLTSDGEVVTNHHVVEGATSVKATVMSTGRTYDARVVARTPRTTWRCCSWSAPPA